MKTTTQTITAPLPVIHDLARIGALYASDEAHKPALQVVTITGTTTGLEVTATDAYALAVWTTTGEHTLNGPIRIMANDLHKHTTAAVKAIGKKYAGTVAATLTATWETWTLTAGPLTTTGPITHTETPSVEPFREAMNPSAGAPFEQYHMGAFQLARLAKTNPNGPDARITHSTYHTPLRPMTYTTEYEVAGHTVTVQVLAMPRK